MNLRFSNIIKHRYNLNYIIAIATFVIISLLTYITFRIYNTTLAETKHTHQKQQYELAKSAANGITFYLDHLIKELRYVSSQMGNEIALEDYYNNQIEKQVIKSIFECDEKGTITKFVGSPLPDWKTKKLSELINFLSSSDENKIVYSSVLPSNEISPSDSMFFIILIKTDHSEERLSAANVTENTFAGYFINFNWLMNEFIAPLKLSDSDFAWILDSDGRLIYHPHHEEMLLRNIKDHSEECLSCHTSFEVQERMLIQKSSTDSYVIGEEPEKIMAYFPIQLGNKNWILAISTYLPDIISNVKNNFLQFFILYGIAIIFIVSLGVIFLFVNIKRIKLIESKRFLEKANAFQEKINHASKLASIGELVDSVAHEINTPTGIISSETDLLFLKECDPKNCCEELSVIKSQTKRIGDYTKRLLNYSRRMPFNPQKDDITKLIDECIFLVSPRLRAKNITIKKNIEVDQTEFIFDWGRMEQVVVNLLNNAIDFVNDDPSITIGVRKEQSNGSTKKSGEIIITIRDNGIGIKKEDIKSIFEPFFSTKPLSKGTGLGLSISKAIVTRHRGSINVESQPGFGTTFIIRLPLVPEINKEELQQ